MTRREAPLDLRNDASDWYALTGEMESTAKTSGRCARPASGVPDAQYGFHDSASMVGG